MEYNENPVEIAGERIEDKSKKNRVWNKWWFIWQKKHFKRE